MAKSTIKRVEGNDSSGNYAYISVSKENGKILLFSSEECGDVVFTKAQARELIKKIEECIKENENDY